MSSQNHKAQDQIYSTVATSWATKYRKMRDKYFPRQVNFLFTTFVVAFSRPGSQQESQLVHVGHQYEAGMGSRGNEVVKMVNERCGKGCGYGEPRRERR